MNVYVETNFVLELTFEQEQCESCEQILQLCEAGQARLIIPAYCLAEPHEKLVRQARSRRELQQSLEAELRQLLRTASYASRIKSIQDIASLMVQSNEEERRRFIQYRNRLLNVGEIVALTTHILIEAASCETTYDVTYSRL
ncbi:PIN domain-containing protein [Phormidesmis sp. 146-12]